jgi:hypothetical protein
MGAVLVPAWEVQQEIQHPVDTLDRQSFAETRTDTDQAVHR